MAIQKIQEIQNDLLKHKYELLLSSSRDEVFDSDWIDEFYFDYCIDYLKLPLNSLSGRQQINEEIVKEQLKKIPKGSLKVLNYFFWDDESYSSECLKIFELLNSDGIALIYIPNRIFEKVQSNLNQVDLFINGIFGWEDGRDKPYVQKQLLPLDCKYIALWISKKESDQLFILTEYPWHQFDDDDNSILKHFHSIFSNSAERTAIDESHQKLVSGEAILFPRKDFLTLKHLYYFLEEASLSKFEFPHLNEKKLMEITELYAGEQFEVELLLHSYSHLEHGDFIFDIAKYKKAKKDNKNRDKIDFFHESTFFKELEKHWNDYGRFSPRLYLDSVDDFIILEIVNYEYSPLSFSFYHPSEWNWDDYKQEQTDEKGKMECLALKINTDEVCLEFLLHFLRSSYGETQLQLASFNHQRNNFISIDKDSWKNIKISLPEIKVQQVIVSALNNTKKIKNKIQVLETLLLTSPSNAEETERELNEMIKRLEMLSESDQIFQWINRRGNETEQIEFKQTLRLDIKTQTREDRIETSALKTIVGFINNNGGYLVIGVSDDNQLTGMEHELSKFHKGSHDKFKIFFGDKISKRIGKKFFNNISYELIPISGKYVFRVKCIKSKNKCFLDAKDYYVRRHAYTEKLDGAELADWWDEHYDNWKD